MTEKQILKKLILLANAVKQKAYAGEKSVKIIRQFLHEFQLLKANLKD